MTMDYSIPGALPRETTVMIIGAGPTGLALALSLQRAGISHVIVDRLAQGLNTSRAGVIHAHTLDVLNRLGVAKELTSHGLTVSHFRIREEGKILLDLGFGALPSAHPYLLMLPQDETERILAERLEAAGGRVRRGWTATGVHQSENEAEVTMEGPGGKTAVKASYVVGADGMHSLVREAMGTPFEGGAYAESFVLADVRMEWPGGTEEVSFLFSPEGLVVVAPLPGGRFRVVATFANPPAEPSIGDIQALLERRGPKGGGVRVSELIWSSRFRIHHRVAKSYRSGRLLLMGDAAHVHSPAGGQGMNTGLVDAVVLGELLQRAIADGDGRVLDEYERLRRPAALQVVQMAGRLTEVATIRAGWKRHLRNAVLHFLNIFPPARRRLLMNLSGLSRRAMATLPPRVAPSAATALRLQATQGEGK